MLNQQVHIHTGNAQARWNRQRRSQSSMNKFTYILEMRKRDGIAVSAQATRSGELSEARSVLIQQVHLLPGNAQVRWNH